MAGWSDTVCRSCRRVPKSGAKEEDEQRWYSWLLVVFPLGAWQTFCRAIPMCRLTQALPRKGTTTAQGLQAVQTLRSGLQWVNGRCFLGQDSLRKVPCYPRLL